MSRTKTTAPPFSSTNQPPGSSKSRKGVPNKGTVLNVYLGTKVTAKTADSLLEHLQELGLSKEQLKKLNHEHCLALMLIKEAYEGDTSSARIQAHKLIKEYTEGKPVQPTMEIPAEGFLTEQEIEKEQAKILANKKAQGW
jgi:hypothetical protein